MMNPELNQGSYFTISTGTETVILPNEFDDDLFERTAWKND